MILLTFALPHESGRFLPLLQNKSFLQRGALPVVTGTFEGRAISVLHTGMGLERAASSSGEFLKRQVPKLVIAAGYAGGLNEKLQTADVMIGKNFTDPALLALAGEGTFLGTLTTQTQVVETPHAKKLLAQITGADAVDMETEAILKQCREVNIPMLSVRAISDPVEVAMPVPSQVWFDEVRQKPRIFSLLAHLGRNPSKIPPFAKFVGGTNLARKELTAFLCSVLRRV